MKILEVKIRKSAMIHGGKNFGQFITEEIFKKQFRSQEEILEYLRNASKPALGVRYEIIGDVNHVKI